MNIHNSSLTIKRIFKKSIADELIKHGCILKGIETHKDNSNWIIFKFLNDDYFKHVWSEIHIKLKHTNK